MTISQAHWKMSLWQSVYKGTQERQLHPKAEAGLSFYKVGRKPGKEGQ